MDLFAFDNGLVDATHGLHLAPAPVHKHGIVLEAEQPFELDAVSCFAGSVVKLEDGRYRLYYSCTCRNPRVMRIAVAESENGMRWERPLLGQMTWEGADTNHLRIDGLYEGANIVQPAVLRLPDGRWRMYCWLHGQDRGLIRYIISESPDGIRWKTLGLDRPAIYHPSDLEVGQAGWTAGLTVADPSDRFTDRRTRDWMAAKRLRSNDATCVYYDEALGLFEMLSVWLLPNAPETGRFTPHDNAPRVLRALHRRVSEDGIEWGDPELILVPDGHDPFDLQFYYLAQHREPDWRIGFLGHYRCWEQTMDIELCFSRDGRAWSRPLRGGFVPRDPVPERGCMSAYATSALITDDETHLLLYTAGNVRHNREPPPGVKAPWTGVMAATWPKGRFAGLASEPRTIGSLSLKPLVQTEPEIAIDADIVGWLRAELRDPFGKAIPGYELHNCLPVQGNCRHVLRWQGGATTAPYRYDAVSLRIELSDGVLYTVHM